MLIAGDSTISRIATFFNQSRRGVFVIVKTARRSAPIDSITQQDSPSNGSESARTPRALAESGSPAAQLAQLGRALGHPLRVEILTALLVKDEASPRELAEELEQPLGTVSYHVRYLVSLEMLELQRMVPRRGAVQHFYSLKNELRRLLPAAAAVLAEPVTTESQAPVKPPGLES
jgi:DNA-binding transcriptional ArsR family regulator